MKSTEVHLISAFKLGRILEEKASNNRRNYTFAQLNREQIDIDLEELVTLPQDEIQLSQKPMDHYHDEIKSRIPDRLSKIILRLQKSVGEGLDAQNEFVIHAAIAGLIEESMTKGAVWNCIQLGRLTQRALVLMRFILCELKSKQLPGTELLKFLTMQTDCFIPNLEAGTHLWQVHEVFQGILKDSKNPKSMESTLSRIGNHVEALPLPEDLKRVYEKVRMAHNRIFNDLAFIDIHELIGDDPEDHFSQITVFFGRQHTAVSNLISLIINYISVFETYFDELSEDEVFAFDL